MKKSTPAPRRKKPRTIDEYLAGVQPEKRNALEKLRRTIHAGFPRAEEVISYGIPAFRLDGTVIAWFAAASRHCSFFPGAAVQGFEEELADFETSKGTVRFQPGKPIPAGLVRRMVKERIARAPKKARKK
ncbi:MAG TPA: DUF1801 domain-containing protein [Thermoanaerobaculia bacterium]|nr:DUF1801 domain-containing protein [Thermoanaerobaculia bacterium]